MSEPEGHKLTPADIHEARCFLAWRMRRRYPTDLDAQDEGVAGGLLELVRAARRYRPERGCWRPYSHACIEWKAVQAVEAARMYWRSAARPGLLHRDAAAGRDRQALEPAARCGTPSAHRAAAAVVELLLAITRGVDRQVLELLRGGRSVDQVAEVLGVSRQRVNQRVQRIRARPIMDGQLRRALREWREDS